MKDTPELEVARDGCVQFREAEYGTGSSNGEQTTGQVNVSTKIGLRMPYDLPMVPYGSEEMPWYTTVPDDIPDWMGRAWPGFGAG